MGTVSPTKTATKSSPTNKYVRLLLLGLISTLALLVNPVDSFADSNLTVHMLQHIGLFVGSAVFGYGLERYVSFNLVVVRKKFHLGFRLVLSIIRFNLKTRGLILGAVVPAVVFLYWHYPTNFDLAVVNGYIHILEHLSYIVAGSLVGLSMIAMSKKLKIILLYIAFMQAGMMGSMMLVWPPGFYAAYSPAQNLVMNTFLMLFGAFGVVALSTWLLKVMDVI